MINANIPLQGQVAQPANALAQGMVAGQGIRQNQNALAQQNRAKQVYTSEQIAKAVIGARDPASAYPKALQLLAAQGEDVSKLPQEWNEQAEMLTRMYAMPERERTDFERKVDLIQRTQGQEGVSQFVRNQLIGGQKAPAGYRQGQNGLEAIPGGPADPSVIREQSQARQTDEFERITDPNTGRVIFERGTGKAGPSQKLSERQSQLVLFGNQMQNMQPVLDNLETQFDPANIGDAAASATGTFGNFVKSQEKQLYDTAAAAWAEGVLRIQTGAAATQPEIERVVRTYFAQPGDTPETVQFKRQARETFFESVAAASGGAVEAPSSFDFEGVSDEALLRALGR